MPKSVECASIDVRQIVSTVTSTKVTNCSTLANRHHRRQRAMLAGVGSKMNAEAAGRGLPGSPVTGLTSRGTYCPMPKPLSRIQLLWQRFCPPPAPANATAPRSERESQLERDLADADQAAGQRPPRVGRNRKRDAERGDDAHGGDLDEDQPLERHVDDRRQRQRRADDEQRTHGDVARIAAEDVARERGRAEDPARPQVREVHHDGQHEPPVLPEPVEPGQRRLAGGERVALDLHVQEELRDDAQHRAPEKDEAGLRGDEGPEDELARRQADAGRDDAGADDAPEIAGRVGKIADDEGLEGHRFRGSGFRGSGFRVQGSRFRVQGSGFGT